MDLFIRSQDKTRIIKFDNVYIYNNKTANKFEIRAIVFENTPIILGEYKTQERCLQILDEIQKITTPFKICTTNDIENCSYYSVEHIAKCIYESLENHYKDVELEYYTYQMPEE